MSVAPLVSSSQAAPAPAASFTLKTENIPDTDVLRLFSRLNFSVPASTFALKENNVKKLEECAFDKPLLLTIVITTAVAALILFATGLLTVLTLALPAAAFPLMIVGLIPILVLYASATSDLSTEDALTYPIGRIREGLYGKYDANGNYTRAQQEFEQFITQNSAAIKQKLNAPLAVEQDPALIRRALEQLDRAVASVQKP